MAVAHCYESHISTIYILFSYAAPVDTHDNIAKKVASLGDGSLKISSVEKHEISGIYKDDLPQKCLSLMTGCPAEVEDIVVLSSWHIETELVGLHPDFPLFSISCRVHSSSLSPTFVSNFRF